MGVADRTLAPRYAATSTAQRSCRRQQGEVGVADRGVASGFASTSTSPRTPFTRGTAAGTIGVAGVASLLLPSRLQQTPATPEGTERGAGRERRMLRWQREVGSTAFHSPLWRNTSVVTGSLQGHVLGHVLVVGQAPPTLALTGALRHVTTFAGLIHVTSCRIPRHISCITCGWLVAPLMAMAPLVGGTQRRHFISQPHRRGW